MKRIWILLMAWACMVNTALADDVIYVDDVNLPLTGGGNLVVKFSFSEANSCSGFSFDIVLPEGVEFMKSNSGTAILTKGDCYAEDGAPSFQSNFESNNDHTLRIGCFTENGTPLISNTGVLVSIKIKASAGQTVDKVLTGNIVNVKKSNKDGSVSTTLSDSQFNMKIVNWIELDENSTIAPSSTSSSVKVKVVRTLKANSWSTICLPFAMAKSKLEDAFGVNGYELAEWSGYDVEKDGEDIIGINMKFTSATTLSKNKPYLIKTANTYSDFFVEGRTIDPGNPISEVESTLKKSVYDEEIEEWTEQPVMSQFIGTYLAETIVPNNCLFISNNQFYFSTGKTKMKAFRAYFKLQEFIDNTSNARIIFSINQDGETTKIDARTMETIETGKVYNLSGQYVGEAENSDRLTKGVYIVNGKKKVIK